MTEQQQPQQQQTVLDSLLKLYPTAKRQTLKRMVQAGRVTVGAREARRLNEPVEAGESVKVDERPLAPEGPPPGLNIVYDDAELLIVDKPAGLLTSTVPRETRPTLLALVREYVERIDPRARVGLIHRLDRDASGLLVFSKTDEAYKSLKTQFYHHDVERVYVAAVHGVPSPAEGRVDSRLIERADGTVYSSGEKFGKGERAITDYETVLREGKLSLVRVKLRTGRKHQIRVHLRDRGAAIVGDTVYGSKTDVAPRLMLAAIRLVVTHPTTGKSLPLEIPTPEDFPLREKATSEG